MKDRLKNVQRSKRIAKRQNDRLRERLNKIIGSEGVELSDDDEDEIEELLSQTENEVKRNYSREHFHFGNSSETTINKKTGKG